MSLIDKINVITKDIKHQTVKHNAEILTAVGIGGMVAAIIMCGKATPKAIKAVEKKKEEEKVDKLDAVEIVRTTWRYYVPVVLTGGASTACIIGANSAHARRTAAFATAYSLSERAYREYKEQVIETIGEKKERDIRDKIAQKKIEQEPLRDNEVILTKKGDTLCYDVISGRYFKSNIETIRRIEGELNKRLVIEDDICLNEFYYLLGLRQTECGNLLSWNIKDGYIDIKFSSALAEDDTPCLVLTYNPGPRYR